MKKQQKRMMVAIVVMIALATTIGIGGKIYMDNQVKQKQEALELELKREKMVATQLANSLKDIKVIEFKDKIQVVSSLAGVLTVTVEVKFSNGESTRLWLDPMNFDNPNVRIGLGTNDTKTSFEDGKSKNVKVIYFNGSEGIVNE